MEECLRQIVPNRCASVRKRSFTKCFSVYMRGDKGSCVERELVTRRRNGYRNPSQHRKLTLENKIRPMILPGLKPTTF